MAGEYINSKAGKKRIKRKWKYREKKDELHTFKDTISGEGHSFIALRFGMYPLSY